MHGTEGRSRSALSRAAIVVSLAYGLIPPVVIGAVEVEPHRPVAGPSRAPREELSKARALIESGSFVEAESLLRVVVERHPRDADARLLLGTALALVPRRSEALEALSAAIHLRPDFAPAHHALGMALARFVEPARARQAFEKAIELDPRFAQAHVNLALLLAQAGEGDRAAGHLQKAIEIQGKAPAAAYAHYLLGLLHSERDQPERAEAAFERAVALRRDYGDAYLQLGLARRRRLDFRGALGALQEAARLSPGSAEAQYELGRELLRDGRASDAVIHLRSAARTKPEDQAVLYSLARALRIGGQPKEAEEAAARLGQLRERTEQGRRDVFQASALNNEGVELERSGKVQAALEKYAAALDRDPLHTVFRRNLALALCRVGRWKEGVQELREVVRLDPNDEEATKALYIALEMAERRGVP